MTVKRVMVMSERVRQFAVRIKTVYSSSEINRFLIPLTMKIIALHRLSSKPGTTMIIGIQGGQGTGKTTLSRFLQEILVRLGYKVQAFSIDDFYESYEFRKALSKKLNGNPFYQIPRGMPGTHRIKFLQKTLQMAKTGKNFAIPVFDKSLYHAEGDISQKSIMVRGKQDFIIFEGWCLGMPAVSSRVLQQICRKKRINLRLIDPELKYHQKVLKFTKQYLPVWKYIDFIVMMTPDSPVLHKQWRRQQERELQQKTGKGMGASQVSAFVDVFLPFTYLCYEKIRPDIKLLLNERHKIYQVKYQVKSHHK